MRLTTLAFAYLGMLLSLGAAVLGCRRGAVVFARPNVTDATTSDNPGALSPRMEASRVPHDAGSGAADSPESRSPREQAIVDLIRAADTDLTEPFESSRPDAVDKYSKLAALGLAREHAGRFHTAAQAVADALARIGSPATADALRTWFGNRRAIMAHRIEAFVAYIHAWNISSTAPVSSLQLILDEDSWTSVVVGNCYPQLPIGGFGVECSARAAALAGLLRNGSQEARDMLSRIATDKTRSGPNPRTLAALTCPPDGHRDEFVAEALASERLIALALLHDVAMLRAVAADPSEPAFLRKWVQLILKGEPYWKRPKHERIHDDGPDPGYAAPCKPKWIN
jgi:hypothetical protein